MTITVDDYLMGRKAGLTFELLENAIDTVEKVNTLLSAFGESRKVSSGYRTPEVNASIPNAAKRSKHMECKACDLSDVDGKLDAWCMKNLDVLECIGLWLEHPSATSTWCHVQTVPPKSGNRVFRP